MMEFIEPFIKTFQTGNGFWHPIIWVCAIIIAYLIVYILRGMGNKNYKEGTEQTKSFLSGNPEYEKQKMHVKGSNVYWGFTESLDWFFDYLKKIHTGNVSDYVFWFVIVIAILLLAFGIEGGI